MHTMLTSTRLAFPPNINLLKRKRKKVKSKRPYCLSSLKADKAKGCIGDPGTWSQGPI